MKNKMPVHKAFLLQACEDYQASAIILAHLQNSGEKTHKESRPLFLSTPFCGAPFFMLLQMSVEKLSKAAYCIARHGESLGSYRPKSMILSCSLRRCWPETRILRLSATGM